MPGTPPRAGCRSAQVNAQRRAVPVPPRHRALYGLAQHVGSAIDIAADAVRALPLHAKIRGGAAD
jgi:hypothetical protein